MNSHKENVTRIILELVEACKALKKNSILDSYKIEKFIYYDMMIGLMIDCEFNESLYEGITCNTRKQLKLNSLMRTLKKSYLDTYGESGELYKDTTFYIEHNDPQNYRSMEWRSFFFILEIDISELGFDCSDLPFT